MLKLIKKVFYRKYIFYLLFVIFSINVSFVIWKIYSAASKKSNVKNVLVFKNNKNDQKLNGAFIEDILLNYDINRANYLYLNEKYLRVVKLTNLKIDSKSIVDRATKKPLKDVLHALNNLNNTNFSSVNNFISNYFHEPGREIVQANFTDWTDTPKLLDSIKNTNLKFFTKTLNRIWLNLYRKFDFDLFKNGQVSSHLPMKHPFIVPGGRFLEIYYWDTYWTIEGLLSCGMFKTTRQMIENFIFFIKKFGFIPNGSRIYYLNRSQPPYFSQMVMSYYENSISSKDLTKHEKDDINHFVLNEALIYMIKEYEYWMKYKSIQIELDKMVYEFNIYKANTNRPRPESFFEDINTARFCHTQEERSRIYTDIISATESGYDFSSRWLNDSLNMCTIQTTDIIPVDLNSIIYKNEIIISKLCLIKGDISCHKYFKRKSIKRKLAINKILWSEYKQTWSDFNHKAKKLNENFYISDLSPLLAGIRPPNGLTFIQLIRKYLKNFTKYEGGLPVSSIKSNQQWDYPNTWAPNQHLIVTSLLKHDRNLSLSIAKKFFKSVYNGWKKYGIIFEKYDVNLVGERGSGGEYEPQSGFGWTNGVVLSFINIFKDDLID